MQRSSSADRRRTAWHGCARRDLRTPAGGNALAGPSRDGGRRRRTCRPGIEAGGHLLGVEPTSKFLTRALDLADGRPVLAAGGIGSREAARAALDAGAAAVVCGTRFLLTDECRAHPAYKRRVLGAPRTLETLLFSVGWSERHRVVPNAATARWCARSECGPRAVLALNRLLAPAARRLPGPLPPPSRVVSGLDCRCMVRRRQWQAWTSG